MDDTLMIVVTTPPDAVERVLDAVALAGGGVIGEYTHCAFTTSGEGRFRPSDAANPHSGAVGTINREPEVRIETFCSRSVAKAVVAGIRQAHPYEEPVIYIIPTLDEGTL